MASRSKVDGALRRGGIMKRRETLQALGALPVAALAPSVAEAGRLATGAHSETADPIFCLFGELVAACAEWRELIDVHGHDADTPECTAAMDREAAVRDALVGLEPITLKDLAAALHVLWLEIDESNEPSPGACARSMARSSALRLLWNIGQATARIAGTDWNPEELYR